MRAVVFAGRGVTRPLPPALVGRVREIGIRVSDRDPGTASLVFDARGGDAVFSDARSPLAPFSRLSLLVSAAAAPEGLFDGVVTEVTAQPGVDGGTVTVTAEDVGVLLDRVERDREFPGLGDHQVVMFLLAAYAADGIAPSVVPPPTVDQPLPIDRIPTQQGTDRAHLQRLAERYGYVTYPVPGSVPGTSRYYWGPAVRVGAAQSAVTVGMGAYTNVSGPLTFRTEATAARAFQGAVAGRGDGRAVGVRAPAAAAVPLGAKPFAERHRQDVFVRRLRGAASDGSAARAQADAAARAAADVHVAEGTLDGDAYGAVLHARGLVGVRGVGLEHSGIWYVRAAEHLFTPFSYTVKFALSRDGSWPTSPVLPRSAS